MVKVKRVLLGFTLLMAFLSISCGIKGPPKPSKSADYGLMTTSMPR